MPLNRLKVLTEEINITVDHFFLKKQSKQRTVVQLVERRFPKPKVAGSIPVCPASFFTTTPQKLHKTSSGFYIYTKRMFRKIATFIHEVKAELRKASWPWDNDPKAKGFPKYKELVDSTIVVLIAMILLAGYVSLFDVIATKVIGFLTGLGH